jgi:hypothetical protein
VDERVIATKKDKKISAITEKKWREEKMHSTYRFPEIDPSTGLPELPAKPTRKRQGGVTPKVHLPLASSTKKAKDLKKAKESSSPKKAAKKKHRRITIQLPSESDDDSDEDDEETKDGTRLRIRISSVGAEDRLVPAEIQNTTEWQTVYADLQPGDASKIPIVLIPRKLQATTDKFKKSTIYVFDDDKSWKIVNPSESSDAIVLRRVVRLPSEEFVFREYTANPKMVMVAKGGTFVMDNDGYWKLKGSDGSDGYASWVTARELGAKMKDYDSQRRLYTSSSSSSSSAVLTGEERRKAKLGGAAKKAKTKHTKGKVYTSRRR